MLVVVPIIVVGATISMARGMRWSSLHGAEDDADTSLASGLLVVVVHRHELQKLRQDRLQPHHDKAVSHRRAGRQKQSDARKSPIRMGRHADPRLRPAPSWATTRSSRAPAAMAREERSRGLRAQSGCQWHTQVLDPKWP